MLVANFTMDAKVSHAFFPNRYACRDTGKSTSQLSDFSSLTENFQTTDAAILFSCANYKKDHKNQQKGKYISTTFASYSLFSVQNQLPLCF